MPAEKYGIVFSIVSGNKLIKVVIYRQKYARFKSIKGIRYVPDYYYQFFKSIFMEISSAERTAILINRLIFYITDKLMNEVYLNVRYKRIYRLITVTFITSFSPRKPFIFRHDSRE